MDRLTFEVDQPYDRFRQRYEAAVPTFDPRRVSDLVQIGAGWDTVMADVHESAPFGFLIYWKLDTAPLMGLAGHTERCTEYLMGNHVMAERMFRFDPSVMLYAPLRAVIYTDLDSRTRFSIDRPSSVFSSFSDREIAAVGKELDAKLIRLLTALEVTVAPGTLDEGKVP